MRMVLLVFVLAMTASPAHGQGPSGAASGGGVKSGGGGGGVTDAEANSRAIAELRGELEAVGHRLDLVDLAVQSVAEEVEAIKPPPRPTGPVHINTADAATLQTIAGVGSDLAQRIIAGRPYHNLRDLLRVPGIGNVRLGDIVGRAVFDLPASATDPDPQPAEAADFRAVYVSSSDGSDANSGLSEAEPVATLEKGISLLDKSSDDRLLMKRGDVWTEALGTYQLQGKSDEQRIVIGAYGDPALPRPLMLTGGETWFRLWYGNEVGNVTIRDIEFYAHTRDPRNPAFDVADTRDTGKVIQVYANGENVTIENCVLRFCSIEVIPSNDKNAHPPRDWLQNMVIRNNVIVDNYSTDAHAQGMYAVRVEGLLIEGNLFDHNGWNDQVPEGERTKYNHNIYLSGTNRGVVIRGNVIARGSLSGIQARPAGVIEGNLFVGNYLHIHYSGNEDQDPDGRITDNVFLATDKWFHPTHSYAIGLKLGADGVMVSGNVVAGDISRGLLLGDHVSNLVVTDNLISVEGAALAVVGTAYEAVTIRGNRITGSVYDRDGAVPKFAMEDNTTITPISDSGAGPGAEVALPEGWLEAAREQWGKGQYRTAAMAARVREHVSRESASTGGP